MTSPLQALIGLFRPTPLDISWLTESLAVGAGPTSRGCAELQRQNVGAIVDLRTPDERANDPGWVDAVDEAGIDLYLLPVTDRRAPTTEQLDQGCTWVLEALADDARVLVCCRAGAQRSATLATAVLIRMGYRLPDAFALVSQARRIANPTDRQVAALRAFADATAQPRVGHGTSRQAP